MANRSKSQMARMDGLLKQRKLPYLFGLLGCGFIDSSVSVVTTLLIKCVLDAIAEKSLYSLYMVSIVFTVIIVVIISLTPLFQYGFGKAVRMVMIDLRLLSFHHMEKLPLSYYENTHSGDSLSRITNDLGILESAFTGNVRSIISLIIAGGSSAVIMFYLDWRFALAMMFMGFVSTYVNSRYAKPLRKISTDIQNNAGILLERFSDQIAGTQVSRIFQMSDRLNQKFKETTRLLAKLSIVRSEKSAYLNSTNYLLLWINNGGAFILGTFMVINGQMTIGNLLSIILLLENVTNLFRNLGNFWANLQSSLAGADRVFELLDRAEEPQRVPVALNDGVSVVAKSMIEFRNGSFAYDKGEKILDGLSFTVDKGHVVALVGPSGGGKSTIIKLLLGFYPLEQGEIYIAGKQFADYKLSELRDQMAYVSQDAYLFEGTIEENIRYGRMDASFEEVVAAARTAHAHDFILEQTNGYDTMVGERGAKLSGGQKQRITIARALLKNAPILLLDEATSLLDSESEQAVQQGLQSLMEGRTTIAIAHRLSTIKHADMIYVIDKGKIAEQGTHDELLEAGGLYSRLHHIQQRNNGYEQFVS